MNFAEVREELGKYAEADFAAFSGKIICTQYPMMGVRTPKLREISKKTTREYLESEPKYYEEVVMHGLTPGAAALTADANPITGRSISLRPLHFIFIQILNVFFCLFLSLFLFQLFSQHRFSPG